MKLNKDIEDNVKNNKSYVLMYAYCSDFYMPDALHVERNDELMLVTDDKDACVEAERDGIKLIYGMEYVPDKVYVDTEENRKIIKDTLKKYPRYKKWGSNV